VTLALSEKGEESAPVARPKLYAVRTIAGRELDVTLIIETRTRDENLPIYSIVASPLIKGAIIVESPAAYHVSNAIQGLRYAKGLVPGILDPNEVERIIKPKAVVETLKPGDIVEIIAGPFKGMKAQVVRTNPAKNEVVLNVLEVEYPLQVTVPGDSVKPARQGGQ
jgi:transcriptional antiterminator NusG